MKYYLVIINDKCYACLHKEIGELFEAIARKGKAMEIGDCLCARDTLQENGFKWSKDFYIKKLEQYN